MLKRLFDIIASLWGLAILSPLFLLTSVAIKLSSPSPVFYHGLRVGRLGKPFYMYKFRTMVVNADKLGGPSTADDDPRITKIGRLLRKFKLDELPQLINVLKGEMSIVGPRPEVQKVVDLYTEREQSLLTLKPGLTDYASLWNIDEGTILKGSKNPHQDYLKKIWPKKVELQLKYLHEQSMWTDLKIVARTIKQLLAQNEKRKA